MKKTALETLALLETLKKLLRKKGITYSALAAELGLSLPSVKRTMNSPSIPLERLVSVCELLGITLADATALARAEGHEGFSFTEEQEHFFAAHPHYLAYFFELLEFDTKEIEKKHAIGHASTRKYLKKLEELKLIEVHPGDKVKTSVRGPILWDDNGILGSTFSRSMLRNLTTHAEKKLTDPGEMHIDLHGWSLNPTQYKEFHREYQALASRYRDLSSFNRKAMGRKGTRYVSTLFLSDYWEDPFFREVKELR